MSVVRPGGGGGGGYGTVEMERSKDRMAGYNVAVIGALGRPRWMVI